MQTEAETKTSLLCACNFAANTGYAWDFIERLYVAIADDLAQHGIRTFVAYPTMVNPPCTLEGSAAEPVELNTLLATTKSLLQTIYFIKHERVRVVYFTDRRSCLFSYLWLRLAGVRRIIVHDHTSGERSRPRGLKRFAKWLLGRLPWINADTVITVSDYVARRQWETGLIPRKRVVKIWNTLPIPSLPILDNHLAHDTFGLERTRPLIMTASRATREKGVHHLLRAFESLMEGYPPDRPRPTLIYFGDGPQLPELRKLHATLKVREDIILAGFVPNAADMMTSAAICVVPSVWHEAFCLAALEGMLRAKPIIATNCGALPELIEHGTTGILVPPGNERALACAMDEILGDPMRATQLGSAARKLAVERFNPERELKRLKAIMKAAFDFG